MGWVLVISMGQLGQVLVSNVLNIWGMTRQMDFSLSLFHMNTISDKIKNKAVPIPDSSSLNSFPCVIDSKFLPFLLQQHPQLNSEFLFYSSPSCLPISTLSYTSLSLALQLRPQCFCPNEPPPWSLCLQLLLCQLFQRELSQAPV